VFCGTTSLLEVRLGPPNACEEETESRDLRDGPEGCADWNGLEFLDIDPVSNAIYCRGSRVRTVWLKHSHQAQVPEHFTYDNDDRHDVPASNYAPGDDPSRKECRRGIEDEISCEDFVADSRTFADFADDQWMSPATQSLSRRLIFSSQRSSYHSA